MSDDQPTMLSYSRREPKRDRGRRCSVWFLLIGISVPVVLLALIVFLMSFETQRIK